MVRRTAVLFSIILCLGSHAFGQSLLVRPLIALAQAPIAQPVSWQVQYDEATARKAEAKRDTTLWALVAVGGLLVGMTNHACEDTAGQFCGETLAGKAGYLAGIGAGVLSVAAWRDYQRASADVHRLSTQQPAPRTTTLNLTDHQTINVALGPRATIAYGVAW